MLIKAVSDAVLNPLHILEVRWTSTGCNYLVYVKMCPGTYLATDFVLFIGDHEGCLEYIKKLSADYPTFRKTTDGFLVNVIYLQAFSVLHEEDSCCLVGILGDSVFTPQTKNVKYYLSRGSESECKDCLEAIIGSFN